MNLSIPISKYVRITNEFAGGSVVGTREPIGRIMTTNSLVPYGEPLVFSGFNALQNVLAYFGASSAEYAVASQYFNWTSKKYTRPQKLSFWRWSTSALNATATSGTTTFALTSFTAISNGTLNFSYTNAAGQTTPYQISGINLSSADSLTTVASTIQTSIQSSFEDATVEYKPSLNNNGARFVITAPTVSDGSQVGKFSSFTSDAVSATGTLTFSNNPGVDDSIKVGSLGYSFVKASAGGSNVLIGSSQAETIANLVEAINTTSDEVTASANGNIVTIIAINPGINGNSIALSSNTGAISASGTTLQNGNDGGSQLADLLGLSSATNVILSEGKDADTLTEELNNMMNVDNNFMTFAFLNPSDISQDQAVEVATWTEQQNGSVLFIVQPPTASQWAEYQAALASYSFVWIQYDAANENKYLMPMMAGACINFEQQNSLINFMYQTYPNFTPDNVMTVSGGMNLYQSLDAAYVNYYASTQQGRQKTSFLQDGLLQGSPTSTTVAVGAWWLKSQIETTALTVFVLNDAIYANQQGVAKVQAALLDVWTSAKNNGAIQVGKFLTSDEKASISAITGNDSDWQIVQSQGYIFTFSINTNPNGTRSFSYRLIYAAADTINSIEGTHIAITSSVVNS